MGIYIRSMEMPRSCDVCDFAIELDERELGTHLYCGFPGIGVYVDDCVFSVHKDCPLIEIPDKHGRLIDADEFVKRHKDWYCENCERRKNSKGRFVYEIGGAPCRACDIGDMIDAVDDAQTIIEADCPPSIPLKQVWTELFGEECE